MKGKTPAIVLGGTGYVAGELLRLIAGHPYFELAGVMSDGQPGEALAAAFPHLEPAYAHTVFQSRAEIERFAGANGFKIEWVGALPVDPAPAPQAAI